MSSNACPLCHKEFKNLKAHLRRKTPCVKPEEELEGLEKQFQQLTLQKYQKPLLKWVGGKTQLLDSIIPLIPNSMENYHEPFLGGGSVLFAFLSLVNNKKIKINNSIYAYDSNSKLIDFYNTIQQSPHELYDEIKKLNDEYNSINTLNGNRKPNNKEEAKSSKESYYYYNRKIFNSNEIDTIKRASLFIFLNKTCFRGVYRESPKSGFNVPFGNYSSTITLATKEDIIKVHNLIKDVIFKCQDFEKLDAKNGDFVYFDPPYYPLKAGKSFHNYTPNGFNKHQELFDMLSNLEENKVKFIMSNAYIDKVKEATKLFNQKAIDARRAIHCKKPGSTCQELLVYN